MPQGSVSGFLIDGAEFWEGVGCRDCRGTMSIQANVVPVYKCFLFCDPTIFPSSSFSTEQPARQEHNTQ